MIRKISTWFSPGNQERKLHIHVPDDYDFTRDRYPVLYMFDGHNLFYDSDATFGTCLGMKEFLDGYDVKMIVVGIACAQDDLQRAGEYIPYHIQSRIYGDFEGQGSKTVQWIVDELKPWVDENFRTCPFRESTAIAGYSLGGMMALYTVIHQNRWFSKAAVISPSLTPAMDHFVNDIEHTDLSSDTLIFFSWGTAEGSPQDVALQQNNILKLEKLVQKQDVRTWLFRQEGGEHNEASWRHQLPVWMDFLWKQR
ncbi:MAG: alpha/beta hydrolase [Bulleidia sp.]